MQTALTVLERAFISCRNFLVHHLEQGHMHFAETEIQKIFHLFMNYVIRTCELNTACEVFAANSKPALAARFTDSEGNTISISGNADLMTRDKSTSEYDTFTFSKYLGHIEIKPTNGVLRGTAVAAKMQLIGQNMCVQSALRSIPTSNAAVVSLLTDIVVGHVTLCYDDSIQFIEEGLMRRRIYCACCCY